MAFDFTLLFSNLLVGASLVVAVIATLVALIGQILVENGVPDGFRGSAVGVNWFSVFLQIFLIAGVIYCIATSKLAMHRFQLGIWSAVALVFSVNGTNAGIYGTLIRESASRAMGAGYLLLCFVNVR